MTSDPPIKKDPFASVRLPEFRNFVLMRFFLTIAINMQSVLLGWKIYEITKDPLSLGLVALAEVIPALAVALFAGHIVDKNDKKKIMALCLVGYLFASVMLYVVTLDHVSGAIGTDWVVRLIYLSSFIGGINRAFSSPALFSLLAMLVPRNLYANATTWNSAGWEISAVAGPAMGGLLYGLKGLHFALSIVIGFEALSLLLMFLIKNKPPVVQEAKENIWISLSEGLKFVFKNKIILSAISLDLFAVLFGGAVALLPVFADKILQTGPEGLGYLRSAPSFGALLTLGILAYKPIVNRPGIKLLAAVFGFGLCIIGFGLSENFYLSLFFLFMTGATDSVSVVLRQTILQLFTPENMRGRVASVNTMFISSSNEIGSFESGLTAKYMGIVTSVVFGGCMTLLVVVVAYLKTPVLRTLNLAKSESQA